MVPSACYVRVNLALGGFGGVVACVDYWLSLLVACKPQGPGVVLWATHGALVRRCGLGASWQGPYAGWKSLAHPPTRLSAIPQPD